MEDKEFAKIIEEQKKRVEDRDIDKLESRFLIVLMVRV